MLSSVLSIITVGMIPGVDNEDFWNYDNLALLLCYWLALTAGIVSYKFDAQIQEVKSQL